MDKLRITIGPELFAPAESSSFSGAFDLGTLEAGPDTYAFAEPLSYTVDVTNTGDAFLVSGIVRGKGVCACGRCLDDVEVDIASEVEGYFLIEEPDESQMGEWEEDEFDVLGDDHVIDLEPLLVAAILVDLPLMPLCREDCAGLCPTCGANLNRESCNCAEARAAENAAFDEARNPFAVLKDLDLGN